MDIQGRRTTRALSNVNENLVKRTAAGKDAVLTRRPALKDQRNGANIPLSERPTGKPIAKATRSVTAKAAPTTHPLQKQEIVPESCVHPEVTGIEREIQFVEYCDQVEHFVSLSSTFCFLRIANTSNCVIFQPLLDLL
ncbi:unnamed protein product [Strongylus vulgaris]|uniref:Uncharacterized protein n=1 Tax=Strongylus vulgaris TaxID=40348 RepID=A0A3P7JCD8_STRVU|nr:unnamed protein product [Strongylus vulgaris]